MKVENSHKLTIEAEGREALELIRLIEWVRNHSPVMSAVYGTSKSILEKL